MADLDRELFTLLDRSAEGHVGAPPLSVLLRRGRRRRRLRLGASYAAAAAGTAAIIAVAVVVVPDRPASRPPVTGQTGTPTSTPTADRALPAVPTPQQLVRGHWRDVAMPPIPVCGETATAWAENELYLISDTSSGCTSTAGNVPRGVAAAAYDPARNRWRQLPAAPAALRSPFDVVIAGERLVAVSERTDSVVALPLPSTDATVGWISLPHVPERFPNRRASFGVEVAGGDHVVVAGTGEIGDGTWELRTDGWRPLPRLPHQPGHTFPLVSLGTTGSHLVAVAVDEVVHRGSDGRVTGMSAHAAVFRLDADGWIRLPRPPELPMTVTHVDHFGDRLLVTGEQCPPFSSCVPGLQAPVGLLRASDGAYEDLGPTPVGVGADVVSGGGAVIAYNAVGLVNGPEFRVGPGATFVFDPGNRHWQRGPSSRRLDAVAVAWTPRGLVAVGPERAQILTPASR